MKNKNGRKAIIIKFVMIAILMAILLIFMRTNVWREDLDNRKENDQIVQQDMKGISEEQGESEIAESSNAESGKEPNIISQDIRYFLENYIENIEMREYDISMIGKSVYLNDFSIGEREEPDGRYILEFMSIDCEHCQRSMYYIEEYSKLENSYPVEIYSFQDDPVDIEQWLAENEKDVKIQPAIKSELEKVLNIKYVPCFLFVEDHTVKLAFTNEISSTMQFDQMLDLAYGGNDYATE